MNISSYLMVPSKYRSGDPQNRGFFSVLISHQKCIYAFWRALNCSIISIFDDIYHRHIKYIKYTKQEILIFIVGSSAFYNHAVSPMKISTEHISRGKLSSKWTFCFNNSEKVIKAWKFRICAHYVKNGIYFVGHTPIICGSWKNK